MIKTYFSLTKSGIIFSNIITAAGGFFLASKNHIDFALFLATLTGLSCIIASACVFNNYIDRDIDQKMDRTKNRALVKKLIPKGHAIIFAVLLLIVGTLILARYTNLLTVSLALAGFFFYVVVYGIWKRRSVYGTVIGSLSGAVPPIVGYCSVMNRFDNAALILFMILVLWQMPHFYAIAIYRLKDYSSASIPVLPVKKGIKTTQVHMFFYIIAYTLMTLMLSVFGYTGLIYLVVSLLLGLIWLVLCIKGFTTKNTTIWARRMFTVSIIVLVVLFLVISVDIKQ